MAEARCPPPISWPCTPSLGQCYASLTQCCVVECKRALWSRLPDFVCLSVGVYGYRGTYFFLWKPIETAERMEKLNSQRRWQKVGIILFEEKYN